MRNKIISRTLTLAPIAILIGVQAFAAPTQPTDPWQIFQMVFTKPLLIIGALMFIFGAITFGMAFSKDDADSKNKAMWVFLSGALLFILGIFLQKYTGGIQTPGVTDVGVNPVGNIKNPTGADSSEMATMLNQLGTWIPMLGFIAMFWGVFEMAKAFKSDDPGSKQKAITIIVAGVALWQIINFMKLILWGHL